MLLLPYMAGRLSAIRIIGLSRNASFISLDPRNVQVNGLPFALWHRYQFPLYCSVILLLGVCLFQMSH